MSELGPLIPQSQKSDVYGRRKPMTRLRHTRRELLKSAAAMSASVVYEVRHNAILVCRR